MTANDWAGLVLTVLSIAAILISGIIWLIKSENKALKLEIKEELKELRPNSGSSMKDQITNLESRHNKLEEKIDKIYEAILFQGIKEANRSRSKSEL